LNVPNLIYNIPTSSFIQSIREESCETGEYFYQDKHFPKIK